MTKTWVHAFRLNKGRQILQRKKQLPAFSRKICTHGLGVIMKWRTAWATCRSLKMGSLIHRILRYLWKNLFFRYFNHFDQMHPIFPGWLTMLAAKASFAANKTISRTFEIYLPPELSKVAHSNTIYEYMLYLQNITAKVNMKYTKITLDVGTAINAFKELWRYPEPFSNVVLHIGDFHFLKEKFKVNFKLGLLC